jgi:2'-5' RNA ligase
VSAPPRKTHRAALVVIPPEPLWPPIQAIRERHDAQYRRWMPHVTLLYPFRPRERLREIRRALEPVCAGIAPFDLELARFDHFRQGPTRFVLWLAPEPARPLIRLQAALRRAFPDCDEVNRHPGGYRPHLTVGQFVSRPKMRGLLARLEPEWKPLRFPVGEIALIAREDAPQAPFRVVERFALRGARQSEDARQGSGSRHRPPSGRAGG